MIKFNLQSVENTREVNICSKNEQVLYEGSFVFFMKVSKILFYSKLSHLKVH